MAEVITLNVDQPKPQFTLIDLEEKLAAIYTRTLNISQFIRVADSAEDMKLLEGMKEANGMLQELIAIVDHCKTDLESIEMPKETNKNIEQIIRTEKPEFYVSGVQMVKTSRQGDIVEGTSLYSTIIKARIIRDTLNDKYKELKAGYHAKIIQYPVF